MHIAYIVPYVPNQIRTRSYNLISYLSHLCHDIDVFTVGSSDADRKDAGLLEAICAKVFYYHQPFWRSLTNSFMASFTGIPLQTVYSWQPQLAKHLTKIFSDDGASQYDVIHVEHLRGSQFGVSLKEAYPNKTTVWDSVDCISHLFKQASAQSVGLFGKLVTRFELERTRKMEGRLLEIFDHVVVTSPVDREALLALKRYGSKSVPISVLSNGVNQEFFHPNTEIKRDAQTLVFSGKMSYHANVTMAIYLVSEIMPLIWKKHPTTRLYIVGKDPPSKIKELEKSNLVSVTGTVDDIRPYLWRATVSVVPLLYGAGVQNKILEAMATGTPVVTTSKALSALQVQAGRELLVADNPDGFSQAVIRLIEDQSLQREIGNAGVSYVRTHHSWKRIALQLVDIYQQALYQNKNSL